MMNTASAAAPVVVQVAEVVEPVESRFGDLQGKEGCHNTLQVNA